LTVIRESATFRPILKAVNGLLLFSVLMVGGPAHAKAETRSPAKSATKKRKSQCRAALSKTPPVTVIPVGGDRTELLAQIARQPSVRVKTPYYSPVDSEGISFAVRLADLESQGIRFALSTGTVRPAGLIRIAAGKTDAYTEIVRATAYTESTHGITTKLDGLFYYLFFDSAKSRDEFAEDDNCSSPLAQGYVEVNGQRQYIAVLNRDQWDELAKESESKNTDENTGETITTFEHLTRISDQQIQSPSGRTIYFRKKNRLVGYLRGNKAVLISSASADKEEENYASHMQIYLRQLGLEFRGKKGSSQDLLAFTRDGDRRMIQAMEKTPKAEGEPDLLSSAQSQLAILETAALFYEQAVTATGQQLLLHLASTISDDLRKIGKGPPGKTARYRFIWIKGVSVTQGLFFQQNDLSHQQIIRALFASKLGDSLSAVSEFSQFLSGGVLECQYNEDGVLSSVSVSEQDMALYDPSSALLKNVRMTSTEVEGLQRLLRSLFPRVNP
jgi:hypothetical protein